MSQWISVCQLDAIYAQTGVCALVNGEPVAIFRPYGDERLYALSNIDPFFHASVLSRGIIAEHNDELWVASPLKKQRFRLKDGLCLEDSGYSIKSYPVRAEQGSVQIQIN